jgi:hypothetical protein
MPFPGRPHRDVLTRRVGNEVVLVHLGTNRIYSLNATAGRLWELFAAGASRDDVFAKLKQEFEVSDETLAAETSSLAELVERERLTEPNHDE